jgi:hypothetical protein
MKDEYDFSNAEQGKFHHPLSLFLFLTCLYCGAFEAKAKYVANG